MSVVSVPFRGHSIVLTALARRAYRRVRRTMAWAGIRETELRMRYVHAFCALRAQGWFHCRKPRPGLDRISTRKCVRNMMTFLLDDRNRMEPDGGPLGLVRVGLPRQFGDVTPLEWATENYEGWLSEYPAWCREKE